MALFTFIIGIRGVLSKKPFLISTKWTWGLIVGCLLSQVLNSFFLSKLMGRAFEISQIGWLIFISVFLYFLLIRKKAYIAYGITGASLREALRHALNKMGLQFEETLGSIKLPARSAEIQVLAQDWLGVGQLKIKKRKDGRLFKEIVDGMNLYFQGPEAKANTVIFYIYIVLGAFMTAIPIFSLHFIKHVPY